MAVLRQYHPNVYSSFAGLPGTPRGTCARYRPRRHCPAPGVPRVAACPRTLLGSPLAPPRCRRSPHPAVYPWGALQGARNVGARGYFGIELDSCLPSWPIDLVHVATALADGNAGKSEMWVGLKTRGRTRSIVVGARHVPEPTQGRNHQI